MLILSLVKQDVSVDLANYALLYGSSLVLQLQAYHFHESCTLSTAFSAMQTIDPFKSWNARYQVRTPCINPSL